MTTFSDYPMSGFYFPQYHSPAEEEELDFAQATYGHGSLPLQGYQSFTAQSTIPAAEQQQLYFEEPQQLYQPTPQPQRPLQQPFEQPFQQPFDPSPRQHQAWVPPTVPSQYHMQQRSVAPFPQYAETFEHDQCTSRPGPSRRSTGYLSPGEAERTRPSRATSLTSNASDAPSIAHSDVSRSVSPNASEMAKWGYKTGNGTWICAYPGCSSKSIFHRGCDLRKHYKRHTKSLFCRHEGCPQASEGGFSSKKDRARHEAKHNPNIVCEWEGCDRLFSRVDNMKDHVRRVHRRTLTH